jgi:hypothetical protein
MVAEVDKVADHQGDAAAASMVALAGSLVSAEILAQDNSVAARLLTPEQVAEAFTATPYRESWGLLKHLSDSCIRLDALVFRALGIDERQKSLEIGELLIDDDLGLEMLALFFWTVEVREGQGEEFSFSPAGLSGERLLLGDFASDLFLALAELDKRLEIRLEEVRESLQRMIIDDGHEPRSLSPELLAIYQRGLSARIFQDISAASADRYELKPLLKFDFGSEA